ncbi:MAG: nitroreductase family protein [Anaerolineales bacterium]|jgi:nitroreductase
MDFKEVIQKRRSVRKFKPESVEDKLIFEILEFVKLAPSAGNLQAYEIIVVKENQTRRQLSSAALDQDFIYQAPVVLVFCAHPARNEWKYKTRGRELYSIQDATIACTYAMLAVTAMGLSSVWVGAFLEEEVIKILELEPGFRPVALLPVGYGDENPARRERRTVNDFAQFI